MMHERDDELVYYGYIGSTTWAFRTPEELGAWAAQHPEGTWDVAMDGLADGCRLGEIQYAQKDKNAEPEEVLSPARLKALGFNFES